MKRQVLASLITLSLYVVTPVQAQSFGTFSGLVTAEWLDNDNRSMRLTQDFSYIDPGSITWLAPAGSIIDGASIPQFAWSIIGSPFTGAYRNASVIHDVACVNKDRPWEAVHVAFYNAMRAGGVGVIKAKVMFAAVYHFGPRWPFKQTIVRYPQLCVDGRRACLPVPDPADLKPEVIEVEIPVSPKVLTEAQFEQLEKEIEKKEASLDPLSLSDIQNFR